MLLKLTRIVLLITDQKCLWCLSDLCRASQLASQLANFQYKVNWISLKYSIQAFNVELIKCKKTSLVTNKEIVKLWKWKYLLRKRNFIRKNFWINERWKSSNIQDTEREQYENPWMIKQPEKSGKLERKANGRVCNRIWF